MDFLFSMSMFSADFSREKGKEAAQDWIKGWVTRNDDGKGAAADQGKQPPQRGESRPQERRQPRARPHFAPEFDGLNCFETIVSH